MQIGVLLQDERGAGIMYGQWQGGRLTVKHINRDVTVQPNAKIITSGLTSRVPKGLIVGFVTASRRDEPTDTLQQVERGPVRELRRARIGVGRLTSAP